MVLALSVDVTKLADSRSTEATAASGAARIPTQLFGTDGIRGKAGHLLTPALALQVGYWAGQVLQQAAPHCGPLIMGQDSRCSGDMLAMSLSAGLTAAGIEVWNLGLCPTPAVAYLTHQTDAIGGVMISASHNPPEDNGIKFFGADGTKLAKKWQQQIESHLHNSTVESISGAAWGRQHYRPELTQDYAASLRSPFGDEPILSGLKVVLDLAWGAAVHLAPQVFTQLGAEVICLHDQPDGACINVNCGSTHLQPLQAAVLEHGADLGFGFDGDSDRTLAVDGTGREVDGDYLLFLWGEHLKEQQQLPKNMIVATVMSNLGFERAWERRGGQFVRSAVGDQHVHAEMLNHQAALGGEQSGHILCQHYGIGGDGIQTALHIAAIVQAAGTSLAELVDSSFQTYPQLLRNVRLEDRDRLRDWQSCEPLQNMIAKATRSMGDQGRVLVRASGTEPLIRVMVEAVDQLMVDHWCEELVGGVKRYLI